MMMLMSTGGVAATNCFLVADEAARQAVLFDAPDHTTEELLAEAARRGWDVIGLWLTHGHFDHFADHAVVHRHFPKARVLAHPQDAYKMEHPDLQTRLFGVPLDIPPCKVDVLLSEGTRLSIGGLAVVVLHTPGHSPGHVAYHFPEEKLLVGGDLIIGGSIGRTDLPDSDPSQMEAALRRVMALPEDTQLLGGHGPLSTLGQERRENYILRSVLE